MLYKKTIFSLLMAVVMCQSVTPAADPSDVKNAIKQAAHRSFKGWATKRFLLLGTSVIPAAAAACGVMYYIGNEGRSLTEKESNVVGSMMVLGACLTPPGAWLMRRQSHLITRDLNWYNTFTSPTTNLNTKRLPAVADINKMNTHGDLLKMTKNYYENEGNTIEKYFGPAFDLRTPGFGGYNW